MNFNIASLAAVIAAVVALLGYIRTVKASVRQTRENDLVHIDAKIDMINKRVDDIYKLLVEKK